MQIVAMGARDFSGIDGLQDPVRSSVERSTRGPRRKLVERCTNLLSAGIARAPSYERNWMLARSFPQDGPAFASGQIAEAVANWLCTGRVMPAATSGLSRYQLGQKRGAHGVYETYTLATLLRDAWRNYPELQPILVEGSPDAPNAKTVRELSPVRRTHHFVMLRMGGRLYVVDGVRGMVFDSLRTYLGAVMLAGHWGESSVRMKWFRIFEGGREVDRSIVAEDSWETPVM
ncbi:MAG: hypothetical protein KF889_23615 [Alphaproteobacteria bacterium]|nr:hypothetical protein [Alphaproteobacteria bacterium]MCW5742844.1 hypothetical protein [Alphaproteobacteria bacterium]